MVVLSKKWIKKIFFKQNKVLSKKQIKIGTDLENKKRL